MPQPNVRVPRRARGDAPFPVASASAPPAATVRVVGARAWLGMLSRVPPIADIKAGNEPILDNGASKVKAGPTVTEVA